MMTAARPVSRRRVFSSRSLPSIMHRAAMYGLAVGLILLSAVSPGRAATYTVTSLADDGSAGTLRSVIANATGNDTILFSVSGTITLLTGQLEINKNFTISGPGANQLAISGNSASRVFLVDAGVTAAISGVTIQNGFVSADSGGGILNNGNLAISNCTLSGNAAGFNGGGIANAAGGTLTVSNSTVSLNSAQESGAIHNSSTATLTVVNSTFSGNSAIDAGGVTFNFGSLKISASTLWGNSAAHSGGGIFNKGGAVELKGTVIANSAGPNCSNVASFTSDGYNLSDDDTCTALLTATGDQNNVPSGLDPAGPQDHGGPTATIALVSGSTAQDAIASSECSDISGVLLPADQRGVARPQGSGCDIGSYEIPVTVTANVCPGGTGPAPCSQSITRNFVLPAGTFVGGARAVAQGTPFLDFLDNSLVCAYPGPSCSVTVTFAPRAPGLRLGAIQLFDNSAHLLATSFISGVGVAPALAFTPGIITTVAGDGTASFGGDGGQATSAQFTYPVSIALDAAGSFYIGDSSNFRVRKVASSGIITTVAGKGDGGADSGDNGSATDAGIKNVSGIAVDGAGNLYIAEQAGHRVRKVDASGIITTFAGNGTPGSGGDGGPASAAQLLVPANVTADGAGNIYISELARVRKVDANGRISTVAGNGTFGFGGDGGLATSAEIAAPQGTAVDSAGNIYIADSQNCRIRKVTASTGIISTVAGSSDDCGDSGDGGPATSAQLSAVNDVTVDGAGDIYIADRVNNRIRKVDASGTITTVAGIATSGFAGDGGPATIAQLNQPFSVKLDGTGNLYIADFNNQRVRKVNVNTSALAFPDTNVSDTSSAMKVQVLNIGNSPLSVSNAVTSENFILDGSTTTCITAGGGGGIGKVWASGVSCDLGVIFAPLVAGNPLTGTLTVTDKSFNVTGAQQTAALTGNGVQSTVHVTVNAGPAGPSFSVDGTTYTSLQDFTWVIGSPHTLATTSPQDSAGTRYTFANWSDGKAISHSLDAPHSETAYAVNFSTSYQLTTLANPPTGGTVTPASGSNYAPGAVVSLTATPASGYIFSGWTGPVANAASASTTVTMNTPQTVTAKFTPALGFVPPSINFGTVTLWGGTTQYLNITNNTSARVKFSKITLSNLVNMTTKDLTYDGGCMSSIAPGKVCRVILTLWPSKTGAASAMLNITGNVTGSPLHVTVTANIIAPKATLNASTLNFANQKVNTTSAPKTVTLTNNGIGPLTLSGVALTGSNTADFAISSNTCGSSLAQGASCTVGVTFTPRSKNSRSANLRFSDNAQSSTKTVSLSGKGI